jgi:hypothetical protein
MAEGSVDRAGVEVLALENGPVTSAAGDQQRERDPRSYPIGMSPRRSGTVRRS